MLRGRVTRINGATARPENVPPDARWVLRGDRGVTWARELPEDEIVVAGDWWPADYDGTPLLSMAVGTATELGLGVGDTVTINILGRNVTGRIANLRNVRWDTLRMNFIFIFSPGLLESAPQTHLATVHADPALETGIERAVAAAFPGITAIRVRDVLDTVASFLERLGIAIRLTAGVAIAAGALVLAGAVAAGHRRRVYDSVVLKVLGATRKRIVGSLLLELRFAGASHGDRGRRRRHRRGLGGGDGSDGVFVRFRSRGGRGHDGDFRLHRLVAGIFRHLESARPSGRAASQKRIGASPAEFMLRERAGAVDFAETRTHIGGVATVQ